MKFLSEGIKKLMGKRKPMAKRTKPRDQKALNAADESAGLDKEILSFERMLAKTTNPETKATLREKLMKLKHKARKNKPAPKMLKPTAMKDMKPKSKPTKAGKMLKSGKGTVAGKDVSKRSTPAKAMATKDEEIPNLPNFLKKQAGPAEPKGPGPKKPKMLEKQAM